MEKITPASSTVIPTVDLSPFMEGGDESCRKMVMDTIFEAVTNYGIFQVENKGVSLDQCEKLLELTKTFFSYPDEVKTASTAEDMEMAGAGYGRFPTDKYHDYEYVLMYSPDKPYNGVPTIQPDYRETFNEVFKYFVKTSQIVEGIINDCLGLPPNLLKTYNNDRCWDYMLPMHYTPADDNKGNVGIADHEDPNVITITLQDDVCGYEVLKDEEWIPIIPTKGKLLVVVSDTFQVVSNKKVRTLTHRAFKNKEGTRLAIDFCYSLGPDKWVEPLHELTEKLGVNPKYRGFSFKDYIALITKDVEYPPASVEDFIDITHYEI